MDLIMGPILGFRGHGQGNGLWKVSALVVSDGDPGTMMFSFGGAQRQKASEKKRLTTHNGHQVWRFEMAVKRAEKKQRVQYMLSDADQKWEFWVPAKDENAKIAYASCNGFSDPKYMKSVKDKNVLWKEMLENHTSATDDRSADDDQTGPFHLLILGGDQVYADSIWQEKECKAMYEWVNKPWKDRTEAPLEPEMRQEIKDFYFRLYCDRWNQADPKQVFASIPTVMMWDDHDIFDGWGSYPDDMQKCPVFQEIFKIARDHFIVFQLQEDGIHWPPHFLRGAENLTFTHIVGDMAIAALDMRSERSNTRVMSKLSTQGFFDWLDGIKKEDGIRHLLVMSSIPLVHLDFSRLEKLLNWIPGQQELEDDLRDHWHSVPHKEERIELIKKLLEFGRKKRIRVSFLSGDVHVAAIGAVETLRHGINGDNANVINQLTCSAIVHPPPPAIVVWAMNTLMTETEEIDRHITARILKFRGTDFGLVGRRNWMSLTMREDHSFIAHWYMEQNDGIATIYSKIVNCCARHP